MACKVSPYSFMYTVKDPDSHSEFGHQETKDSFDTKGHYFVHLPTGSHQYVSYYVSANHETAPIVHIQHPGYTGYSHEMFDVSPELYSRSLSYSKSEFPNFSKVKIPTYSNVEIPNYSKVHVPNYSNVEVPTYSKVDVSSNSEKYEEPSYTVSEIPSSSKHGVLSKSEYEAPATNGLGAVASPQYAFGYGVKDDYTGSDFGHEETRDGYDTKGSYYVNLPDGRLQKVSYYVSGDSGFVAEVTYVGEALYPDESTKTTYV
ncbi:uncharacterized protein LOC135218750 [Macrobrachium nipponense]|uniref:uncharacterized protein LOC135218750 n=1 Tax=Macrobrachium nipponense TaxID=159736 RepID=UPI0030C8CFA3